MSRPSKQFIIRGSVATAIVAVILIAQTAWFQKIFHKKESTPSQETLLTVGDIVTKDSNGNSIPDWEEKLWGLDPTVLYTNGIPNSQIIENKKQALGVTDSTNQEPMNETDRLSRELFTLATALGQSEEVDSATLEQIAAAFGSSIDTDRIENTYSLKDVQTIKTTSQSLTTYTTTLKKILARYDKNQADIDVVVQALETGDETNLPQLATTTTTYRALAKELSALPTPIGLAGYHLDILNALAGIADSFTYIQELPENGVGALIGIASYREYSTKLDTAVLNMGQYLSDYGILSS